MEAETRHLVIDRRVRYAVIPGEPDAVREIWFGLHGYNQLAPRFIRHLRPLASPQRTIVAPEGLHRQYIDHAAGKVGASWMTSEDRLTDIADYVAYLDRLATTIREEPSANTGVVRIVALGFSQGVHTLCRWLAFGRTRIDRAILWGGTVPPDLDLSVHGSALGGADLQLVVGADDEFFGAAAVEAHERQLEDAGIPFRAWSFEGGHRLHGATLTRLAETG